MPSTKTKTIYWYFVFILLFCVKVIVVLQLVSEAWEIKVNVFFLHFVNKTLNNKYSYKFFILQYRAIQHSEIVIKCFLQCKVFVILLNFYY